MAERRAALPRTTSPSQGPGPRVEPEKGLQQSLDNRHIVMIALGGIIGAGLFVGSGAVINRTGPAAVLSYSVSGVLMILVIRAIGEMAVARPSSGSVANFSREGLGNWAGFSVGWLYWYFWVVVAAIEAVAGAGILAAYIPGVPPWLLCLGLVLVLTGLNLLSVKAYGEAEFWFASIKVVAIIFFICVTALYLLGAVGKTESPGLTNLFAHGGLFPHGLIAALIGSVTVLFSMGGAEIATIAAAESKKPVEFAAKATKQVMTRVFAFYVVSILLIVAAVPWDTPFTGDTIRSPFAVVLERIGLPGTSVLMEAIVLTAVLSSLNSCLYITSRMLFALADKGDAPKALVKVNKRGVPTRAILAGTSMGYAAVVANYFFPEQVFIFLINSSGAIQLIYYIILVRAEIRLRRRLELTDPGALRLKMWCFPYLSWFSIGWMVVVLAMMAWIEETRYQLLLSLFAFGIILLTYRIRASHGPAQTSINPSTSASTALQEEGTP